MNWHTFDIHGRVSMRVADDAPTADQLCTMFAHFLCPPGTGGREPDLTVTGAIPSFTGAVHGEYEYTFTDTEDLVVIEATGVCIARRGAGWAVHGTRELLTSVLPLIDRAAVTSDMAMIHAATVTVDGRGIALPAWGGVGKTSTVAQLVARPEVEFLGDDWAFVDTDSRLYGFHKPMFIKPHHRPIYPHLFDGVRKPLVPSSLSKPLSQFTTRVHPLATKYPQAAARLRKWTPEYRMVTPPEAFPSARMGTSAPLTLCMFVERADRDEADLREVDRAWMVSRTLANFHAEMSLESREVLTALAATSLLPLEQVLGDKAAVLDRALDGVPTFRLLVPTHFPPSQAAPTIVAQMHQALEVCGA